MALAGLCAAYRAMGSHDLQIHAFVVDHGLRNGSDDEAEIVARRLRRLSPSILGFGDWPRSS